MPLLGALNPTQIQWHANVESVCASGRKAERFWPSNCPFGPGLFYMVQASPWKVKAKVEGFKSLAPSGAVLENYTSRSKTIKNEEIQNQLL